MSYLRKFVACLTVLAILVGFRPISLFLSASDTASLLGSASGAVSGFPDEFFRDQQSSYDLMVAQAQGMRPKSGEDKANLSIQADGSKHPGESSGVPGENDYIVVFDEETSGKDLAGILEGYNYKQLGPASSRTFLITCDDVDKFMKQAGNRVVSIEKDSVVVAGDIGAVRTVGTVEAAGATGVVGDLDLGVSGTYPYDDDLLDSQWAVENMDLWGAWGISRGSDTVKIAVIDTGLRSDLQDFEDTNILYGWDFIENTVVTGDPGGHGTMVTSIIAATPGNSYGVAGICEFVTIVPLRILNDEGEGTTSDLISAVYMAADLGVDIINMSLGSEESDSAEAAAIQYALSKSCIVIAAAGNAGDEEPQKYFYPASYNGVISVASHTEDDLWSYFSTYNNMVDVSAPGSSITVLGTDGGFYIGNGTSFAAPQISGIAALARAVDPAMTPDELLEAIAESSRDLGITGKDAYYGYGAVDADDLLNFIIDGNVIDPPDGGFTREISPVIRAMTDMSYSSRERCYTGSFQYFSEEKGLYTFTAVSPGDSDIFLSPDTEHSEYRSDTADGPFWFTADLLEQYLNQITIKNYYESTTQFVVSAPEWITGSGVLLSSGGNTDRWSQSLIFDAGTAGKKSLLIQPRDPETQYMVGVYDNLFEPQAVWEDVLSGAYYLTYDGQPYLNHVNVDILCDDFDGAVDFIFEEMTVLTEGANHAEVLGSGDTLAGATFVAPVNGTYRFETDAAGAVIDYVDNLGGNSFLFESNSCEVELTAGMEVDFYIHTDGSALTQNLGIRKLSGVSTLASIIPESGTLSPAFDPAVTEYALDLNGVQGPVSVSVTPSDENSFIDIGGIRTSGTTVDPAPGETEVISVLVTSEDGMSETLYLISAYRPSDIASIEGFSGDATDHWIHPEFPVAYFYLQAEYTDFGFVLSEGAVSDLFADRECTTLLDALDPRLSPGLHVTYVKVTAENGTNEIVYTLLIYVKEQGGGFPFRVAMVDDKGTMIPPDIHTSGIVCVIPFGAAPFVITALRDGGIVPSGDIRVGFDDEGVYHIDISDDAGQSGEVDFVIDRTAPVVTGVSEGKVYYKPAIPHFTEGTATLNGQLYLSDTPVTAERNHVLIVTDETGNTRTVNFRVAKRAVTFNSNGGSFVAGTRVFDDEKITEPARPVRSGYDFLGWYRNAALTDAWDFLNDTVSADVILYASWKATVPQALVSVVYSVNEPDEIVSRIAPETRVSDLVSKFDGSEYIVVKRDARVLGGDETIATGDRIMIMNGPDVVRSYDVVVTGDVNGDARISLTDFIQQKAHILGKISLSGVNALAADVNADSRISLTDFIKTKAHILGKSLITPQIY